MKSSLKPAHRSRWNSSFAGKACVVAVLVACSLMLPGCDIADDNPAPPFDGLATIWLTITPEALQVLNTNRNSNAFVSTVMEYVGSNHDARQRWTVDIRNAGQFSRRYFKRNYRLRFAENALFNGYPLMNLSSQPTDETKLRSVLGYAVLRAGGFHVPRLEPVALYINNEYQGLYYLIEPIDKSFYDRRGVSISSLFEAQQLEARWSYVSGFILRLGYAKIYPEDEDFTELDRLIRAITFATPETIEQRLSPFFDFDGYIRYQACMIAVQNFDSWTNNFHFYHDNATGKLHLQPWDVDHAYDTELDIHAPTPVNDLIVANTALHRRYLLKLIETLDGEAYPAVLGGRIDDLAPRLAEAFDADPYNKAAGRTLANETAILKTQILESHTRLRAKADSLLQQLN